MDEIDLQDYGNLLNFNTYSIQSMVHKVDSVANFTTKYNFLFLKQGSLKRNFVRLGQLKKFQIKVTQNINSFPPISVIRKKNKPSESIKVLTDQGRRKHLKSGKPGQKGAQDHVHKYSKLEMA